MRILLHMGQGKTGTTALQRALHANRKLLAQHGIFYPAFARHTVAHHMLIALCVAGDRVPPHVLEPFGSLDMLRAKAAAALYQLKAEVEQTRPKVLILSSETFFHGLQRPGGERLARMLAPLSSDICPVAYVREPGSLYRSRLQERMRVAATPLPPAAQRIRQSLEDSEAVWGGVSVCPYDPARLVDGDILRDFATRFLADLIDPCFLRARSRNRSLSAEAILIISRFRKLVAPDRDWHQEARSDRLLQRLLAIEATGPRSPVALRPGIADSVRRASTDYLWLRDHHGVTFPEIDYAKIDGVLPAEEMTRRPLEDLILLDRDRYDEMLLSVLAAEMGSH